MATTITMLSLPQPAAVWTVDVSSALGKENLPFVEDLTRMVLLQLVIQTMLHVTDPERFGLFDASFLVLLMFVVVAVTAYWLVFKRLVRFE